MVNWQQKLIAKLSKKRTELFDLKQRVSALSGIQKAVVLLSVIAGIYSAYVLNYYFLEDILIPDPCRYHVRETPFLFDFFYDFPASEGGHPVASFLNYFFTVSIGAIFSFNPSCSPYVKNGLLNVKN